MENFTKIESCETYEENFNIQARTVSKVYRKYKDIVNEYEENLKYSLELCESPIEQLLRLELERINLINTIRYNKYIDIIEIQNQAIIDCGKNRYRVDFLIPVFYKNQGGMMFVIECDGYEFHQKTKEQVEQDNKRTRDLQKAGYEIIRFSGTEIWHSSYKCACEIKNIIFSKCEYKVEQET